MTWKLGRVRQCRKCPWKVTTDPHDIPNGYDIEKHKSLHSTIAKEGDLSKILDPELRVMACHETATTHCIGWLSNQIAHGNNIQLRLSVLDCENIDRMKLVGRQHFTFADTLPKEIKKRVNK